MNELIRQRDRIQQRVIQLLKEVDELTEVNNRLRKGTGGGVLTPKQFAQKISGIATEDFYSGERFDKEAAHSEADNALCALLETLGYVDGIRIFRAMDKWYA